MSVASPWAVAVGAEVFASINDPSGGLEHPLGARIEMPYTRAIVSQYELATLADGIWTVKLEGVLAPGIFNFVWLTNDAEPSEYEVFLPLQVSTAVDGATGIWTPAYGENYPPVDLAQVTPTVDDVAQLERTRTFDSDGNELITFTDATRPTDSEVLRIIHDSVPVVLGTLPTEFDPHHYTKVRQVIAIYCAMTIEGSFFKEQALRVGRGGGSMPWEAEYTAARDRLEETINEDRDQNNLLGAMEPRPATYVDTGLA